MPGRRSKSKQWRRQQATDTFVKQRDRSGYRSRAAFKLLEILKRDRLVGPGGAVLDLGASPGGWTQVAVNVVGPQGIVVGVDILGMDPVNGAVFVEGDCRDVDTLHKIRSHFGERPIDLVISDMAPNITGIRDADEANSLELAEMAGALGETLLGPGGNFVIKLFQFPGTESYIADLKRRYASVVRRKPESSRKSSREFYVVAKGFGI